MLTNDYAALCDELLSGVLLVNDREPAVGVGNIHYYVREYRLDTKIEACITGNNLCVRISAYITNLNIAVGIIVLVGKLACVNEFLDLHSGYNTGNVT